ncbi:MAG: ubiquinone/menaquinone biosynthesis methyltransferase [Gammaproteobacteria bacterium]
MRDFSEHSSSGGRADFGFADVAVADKSRLVGGVFSRVAPYYDRMNDLMSAGLHRRWKDAAVLLCGARRGMRVLDLACGSGDLAARLLPRISPGGNIALADINLPMLNLAKQRITHPAARFIRCDGECLPFADGSFDRVITAFGLRNISRRETALAEMRRVLRPGGLAAILEFSPPAGTLAGIKTRFLQSGLPFLGESFFGDAESYRYLGESVLRFPPPQALCEMMCAAGFARADFFNIAFGAVYLHRGRRIS